MASLFRSSAFLGRGNHADSLHQPDARYSRRQILVDGVDISKLKGKAFEMERRNIGMIFQSFNLVKRASVYKNVLAGRVGYHNTFETLFGIYSKEEKILALPFAR
jgi:ABC-type phosphate/phosphonate transport system ATPase subunit